MKVGYDGFYLDGKRVPIYSGAIHYWRLERNLWSDILDNVKGMGFRVVETYIPWSIHELERGKFDFGQIEERKDIDSFLSLCKEKDLYVLVRPGPHINAELTYFGYPERILEDPEIQAKTSYGTIALYQSIVKPFPIPSYASEKFYQEVALYFDALFPILCKHLSPRGPIIGIQADNELAWFFRLSAYDLDYSQGSIELYRQFLRRKYKRISNLNKLYRSNYLSFRRIEPPRDFKAKRKEELPFYLDWAEYKEYHLQYALNRIAKMFRERGIVGVPIFHNLPEFSGTKQATPGDTPLNLTQLERGLDVVGIDIYPLREDYEKTKRKVQYLVGTSRMPFVPEFGSGTWPWRRPSLIEDEKFTTLVLFMYGVKAINYYMVVERDRWLGSPITRDNRRRLEYYEFYQKLNGILEEIDYASFRKVSQLLLLANREYERLQSVTALLPTPLRLFLDLPYPQIYLSEEKMGFKNCIPLGEYHWWNTFYEVLSKTAYGLDLSDSGVELENLKRYKLVVISSFDYMSNRLQEKLVSYARGGGLLLVGPEIPYLDEKMERKKILARYLAKREPLLKYKGKTVAYLSRIGQGGIVHLELIPDKIEVEKLKALIEAIAPLAKLEPIMPASDPFIETTLHRSGERRLLFAANPKGERRETIIEIPGSFLLKDLWTGEEIKGKERFTIEISPYTVKIWEVFPG